MFSHRAGCLSPYLKVDTRFCFFFRWFSGEACSGCFGARVSPVLWAGSDDHHVFHTGMLDVRPTLASTGYGISHPTSPRCSSADVGKDSCEVTSNEKGHCTAGQIADSTAISNAPDICAEGDGLASCARCLLRQQRVARRTGHVSGLCVKFPCLVFPFVSRLAL